MSVLQGVLGLDFCPSLSPKDFKYVVRYCPPLWLSRKVYALVRLPFRFFYSYHRYINQFHASALEQTRKSGLSQVKCHFDIVGPSCCRLMWKIYSNMCLRLKNIQLADSLLCQGVAGPCWTFLDLRRRTSCPTFRARRI